MSSLLPVLLIFCGILPRAQSATVTTKYGNIEGLTSSYPNASGPFKSVSKFLGVPFADPPIGELRFRAPQPPKEWKPNVHQAKQHGNICLQDESFAFLFNPYNKNYSISEDCLYLDVYTPNVSLSLPVMVYIHGGGYEAGATLTYPSDMLALQGVVVVVIQYRLGPFGFLTTGDSAAPGNFGMLDQVQALKWVKENIESFGGNPGKVTIFGESAGAASVTLHLMSPLSKNLFNQAIAESGVDLSPWATQPSAFGLNFAKELARKLNCPTGNHQEMVACIKKKEAKEIVGATKLVNFPLIVDLRLAPVVDKNFLHDTPEILRKKGDFKNVPLMISFNSDEAGIILSPMIMSLGLTERVDDGVSSSFFNTFLARLAYAHNFGHSNKTNGLIAEALKFMYTPWPDNNDNYALRSQLVNVISDFFYFAPSHEVADIHSRVAPVYMYEFAHRANVSYGADWMGVVHLNNVPFDFGIPLHPSTPYNAADKNVSLLIMAMYANFARSGNPSVSGFTWERYNSSHRAYLRVDSAHPKMTASFHPYRMAFWNTYHSKLAEVKFDIHKKVVCNVGTRTTIAALYQIALIFLAVFVM